MRVEFSLHFLVTVIQQECDRDENRNHISTPLAAVDTANECAKEKNLAINYIEREREREREKGQPHRNNNATVCKDKSQDQRR